MTAPSTMRALSLAQRRRLRTWALASAVAFFVVALAAHLRVLIDGEWRVQHLVQAGRAAALERPMRALSLVGSGWVLLPAAVAGALVIRRRHGGLAVAVVAIGAAGMLAANLAKLLVIRQRPNTVLWAYPSAHTFGIVLCVGLVLYVSWALGAPARGRRFTALLGALLVVAVAASRVYLNAHWIGDVVGGLAGGLAFLLAAVLVVDHRLDPVTG